MVTIQGAPWSKASPASQKKKQHSKPNLDKEQCSFCCYSKTRPAMSPKHICKIINRCLKCLLRPTHHKHTLYLKIWFGLLSHPASQFLSTSSAHVLKHFRPQTFRYSHKNNTHLQKILQTHLFSFCTLDLALVKGLIPFQQNNDHKKQHLPILFCWTNLDDFFFLI